jgi:hypothetical protein
MRRQPGNGVVGAPEISVSWRFNCGRNRRHPERLVVHGVAVLNAVVSYKLRGLAFGHPAQLMTAIWVSAPVF